MRRRPLTVAVLTLGLIAAIPAEPSSLDRRRLAEAREVRVERKERDERSGESRTVSSARADGKWLTRLGQVAMGDAGRVPDSVCAVACGRCPDQLVVNVTWQLPAPARSLAIADQRHYLTLYLREGLAFLRSDEMGEDRARFIPAFAWSIGDSLARVAELLRELKGGTLFGPDWQPPATHAAPPSPDSAAYRDDDVLATGVPEAIAKVWPKYPPLAENNLVEREVKVKARVTVDGRVDSAAVAEPGAGVDETSPKAAGIRALNEAAVEAVRQWRFKPATCGGHPVAIWVIVPVRFSLR